MQAYECSRNVQGVSTITDNKSGNLNMVVDRPEKVMGMDIILNVLEKSNENV